MKKVLCLIVAIMLVLALCGCGAKAPEAVKDEPAPAATPEAVAETAAPAAPAAPEPAPASRKAVEVEISKDNFEDYFELCITPDYENAEVDANGDIISLTVYYDYVLKNGVEAAYDKAEECELVADFSVECTQLYMPEGIDFEALTCEDCENETPQSFPVSIEGAWWNPDGTICEKDYESAVFKMTVLEFTLSTESFQQLDELKLDSVSGKLWIFE